jgi:hypothetical protein
MEGPERIPRGVWGVRKRVARGCCVVIATGSEIWDKAWPVRAVNTLNPSSRGRRLRFSGLRERELKGASESD